MSGTSEKYHAKQSVMLYSDMVCLHYWDQHWVLYSGCIIFCRISFPRGVIILHKRIPVSGWTKLV